jgi:hypothetical protein
VAAHYAFPQKAPLFQAALPVIFLPVFFFSKTLIKAFP